MKLFDFNIQTGKVTVRYDELMVLQPFKNLINKHKFPQHITLEQNLAFIWYVTDVNSPGILAGYTEERLEEEARKLLNISKNWAIDKETSECIKYIFDNESADKVALKELLISLNNIANLIKMINEELDRNIRKGGVDKSEIPIVLGYINQINNILSSMPENIDKVSLLRTRVLESERGGKLEARGGEVVTSSMIGEGEDV